MEYLDILYIQQQEYAFLAKIIDSYKKTEVTSKMQALVNIPQEEYRYLQIKEINNFHFYKNLI